MGVGVEPDAYHLPHPRYGLPIILIIRRVLIRAFEILRERDDCPIGTAQEDEITIALRGVIENRLRQQRGEVSGFDRQTFERVQRQHRGVNYSGTANKVEPDMRFTLRDDSRIGILSTEDGLTVECKPVDPKHSPTSAYCREGVRRFVEGEYAWAMEEALMIAYARCGRAIASHLLPAMSTMSMRAELQVEALPTPVGGEAAKADDATEALHASVHQRSFSWRDGKGRATPITIYHSWHRCD